MSLSEQTCLYLEKNLHFLDISPSDRGCFYHTSILQGIAYSKDDIKSWLLSGESMLNSKSIIKDIAIWDKFIKGIDKSYIVDFTQEYSAICLSYSLSNYINSLSKSLAKEFKSNDLIFDMSKLVESLKNDSSSDCIPPGVKYALDYQYQATAGLVKPHTTLGFGKDIDHIKIKFDQISRELLLKQIKHESIFLTFLDEFCMTPFVNRLKVADIHLEN